MYDTRWNRSYGFLTTIVKSMFPTWHWKLGIGQEPRGLISNFAQNQREIDILKLIHTHIYDIRQSCAEADSLFKDQCPTYNL